MLCHCLPLWLLYQGFISKGETTRLTRSNVRRLSKKSRCLNRYNGSEIQPTGLERVLDMIESSARMMTNEIRVSYPMTLLRKIVCNRWLWLVFVALYCLMGCVGVRVGIRLPCPSRPTMSAVPVVNGSVSGPALDSLMDNWQELWAYIRSLEAITCKK